MKCLKDIGSINRMKGIDASEIIRKKNRRINIRFLLQSIAVVGEEYLLEETIDECKDKIEAKCNVIDNELKHWIGYVYRYWHYHKNESIRKNNVR